MKILKVAPSILALLLYVAVFVLTENGLLHIFNSAKYPGEAEVAMILAIAIIIMSPFGFSDLAKRCIIKYQEVSKEESDEQISNTEEEILHAGMASNSVTANESRDEINTKERE